MSEREKLANRIYEYLVTSNKFTAPYGVIQGIHAPKSGRGKVRTITFGFARTLDATLYIWSARDLQLHTSRDDHSFKSEQEFYDFCAENYGTVAHELS